MAVRAIPEGIHTLTPNLALDGAAEAIAFYEKAFGAVEHARAPDPSGKKIWHAEIQIGDSRVFLNDVFPEMGGGAKTASLWVYCDDVDGWFERATKAGAKADMPPADMFWGDRMGKVTDRWGVEWTLAQHVKDMSPEEMKKAQDDFLARSKH